MSAKKGVNYTKCMHFMHKHVESVLALKEGDGLEAIRLKYGEEAVELQIDKSSVLALLNSKGIDDRKPEGEIILDALANPIESPKLSSLVKPGETVCIVISDMTRSWQRIDLYLPYIIEELNQAGIRDEDITLLCATGSHRKQSKEEHEVLIGENLAKRFEVIDHDCKAKEDLKQIGVTSYGTPVIINKHALEKDHIILTGAIVFHDLAGWGGGKKSILPGIAAYESIMANHKLSLNPNLGEGTNSLVCCGNAVSNPVHLDMLEAAAFVNPTFLFNVIVDEKGKIAQAVAGDYKKAHEYGQRLVDAADSICISELADIVIASAGGYPKDIDLYQASKALINAKEAVKKGGTIILLAECVEGFGGSEVQHMLEAFTDNSSREIALRENFTVAKYTGYLIAEIAETYRVILVAALEGEQLKNANITLALSAKQALSIARERQGADAKLYIMPSAANTLPRLLDKSIKNSNQ